MEPQSNKLKSRALNFWNCIKQQLSFRQINPSLRTWTLNGSNDPDNITRRLSFLSELFCNAKEKGAEIAQIRQTNLNFAIIIFGGLLTISLQFTAGWYLVCTSIVLFVLMCFFSLLDRRFHKRIHGWKETEKLFMDMTVSVINNPSQNITFVRFEKKGEDEAEICSLQPLITYMLVAGALVHLIYCLIWGQHV